MRVAFEVQFSKAVLVTDLQPRFDRHFPDAGQFQFWELLFPGIEQRDGLIAGYGEQQFEILAVSERREQGRFGGRFGARLRFRGAADGNGARQQFRSDTAGP